MATATKTAKVENYTAEQTENMRTLYVANPTRETVDTLAETLGKSVRSVIAKLTREVVYVKAEYKTKTGEKVEKKDKTADAIAATLRLTEPEIESLTKANKTALKKIFEALANSRPIDGDDTE